MTETTPETPKHGRRWNDRSARLQGLRTWTFSVISLCFLIGGLNLCLINPVAGVALFAAYAMAVVGIVGVVGGKSAVESLSLGDGVKGAWTNLTTSKKPGAAADQPPAIPPQP